MCRVSTQRAPLPTPAQAVPFLGEYEGHLAHLQFAPGFDIAESVSSGLLLVRKFSTVISLERFAPGVLKWHRVKRKQLRYSEEKCFC